VILLSGESGIGKSRLVQVLKDHVAAEPHTQWECYSSPYYQNTTLYPITELIQRILQWQTDETPAAKLKKLEHAWSQYRLSLAETIPLFAPLLSLPLPDDRYPSLHFSPQRQRQKTLESMVTLLLAVAEQQPVLFILEDLHWTDPTTLEFLSLLVEQVPAAAIYILLTCRPYFQPSWHHRSYLTEITVNRLSRNQIEQMATHLAGGKALPTAIIPQLVDKTDGVPLYVEEMTKALLESGHVQEMDGHYELTGVLSSLAIPVTLQDSLMARLDRLTTAKAVAQYGSVMGRQFSYALLRAVSQLDETVLQHELSRLVEAELLYQRGLLPHATYIFKHALIRDSAYESLLRSTRQQYHQRIARTLEDQFPETAENQPELLAYHYTEAGLTEPAVTYWHQAGQRLVEHLAPREAIAYLSKGLELLRTLTDNPARLQQELRLLTTLGPALIATKGPAAPEVESVYTRAHALCQQVADNAHMFPVLRGLCNFYLVRKDLRTARALAEQLLQLGHHDPKASHLTEAHRMLGTTLLFQGAFAPALAHFDQCLTRYDAQHAPFTLTLQDPGIGYLSYRARTLWCLGYPDQALACMQEALTRAQQGSYPHSLISSQVFMALVSWLRHEPSAVQEHAEAGIGGAREQGFQFQEAFGLSLRGWALVTQRHVEAGMADIYQGIADLKAAGASALHGLVYLIEACAQVGRVDEGLTVLAEALTVVDQNDERLLESHLHRLKGTLLLQQSLDNQSEAASHFHQALAIAQNQSAKSWELRAATSLAKLWQQQGKCHDAYDLLTPVYNCFTEGFDTADLMDARALLDEWS
jgi:predicted ATPase